MVYTAYSQMFHLIQCPFVVASSVSHPLFSIL